MKKKLYLMCLLLAATGLHGQDYWHPVEEVSLSAQTGMRRIVPQKYRTYALDYTGARDYLMQIPVTKPAATPANFPFTIPGPDGQYRTFVLEDAHVFAPGLQAKYPDIRAFKGYDKADPAREVRLEISPQGFHAMVFDPAGQWFIDPYAASDVHHYVVYYKRDYHPAGKSFHCAVDDYKPAPAVASAGLRSGDNLRREYRLALACTGEYAQFHGGTVASALAAMNTSMNRLNGVYEREVGIHMTMVDNNDQIIFLNGATDPYTNNDGATMLDENQTTIDNIIGTANYDIGHVFSTGGGGIARLQSPCSPSKAKGVTGSSQPVGDPFDIDYVAHEMGHQFGANHTQNNDCNRVSGQAFEPGSASTIMGYAGVCFPNVQNHSDDYFHAGSLEEINNFIQNNGNCSVNQDIGNTPPVVSNVSNYIIPKSTPFVLTAQASDADGDSLTYCWEQMDPEFAPMPPENTSVVGPLFRSFTPTPSPRRFFPRMQDLLNNASPTWEVLPAVTRDLKFRATVRDNHPNRGCTAETNMVVTVTADAGPFVVTQPNTNVSWPAYSYQTVTWDVAGTNQPPVSASTVDIILSLDGGNSFSDTLAQDVPNTGSYQVLLPNQTTAQARIMVIGHNHIFFDISDQNFTIGQAQPGFHLSVAQNTSSACTPASLTFNMNVESISGFTDTVSLTAQNVPSGMAVSFSSNPVTPPATVTVTAQLMNGLSEGMHEIQILGTSGNLTDQTGISIFSASGPPAPAVLMAPADGATDVDLQPLFTWNGGMVTAYTIEIYADPQLQNLVVSANTGTTESYQMTTSLIPSQTYYWRVKSDNPCGQNVYSSTFSFTTKPIFCETINAADVPVTIPADADTTVSSTITIPSGGAITSIKVKDLDITHTYISDLVIKLLSPDNTSVILLNQVCGSDDNMWLSFSDDAPNAYGAIPCPPTSGDVYHPYGNLNDFLGKEAAGTWTLEVQDVFTADGGTINGWSLDVCYVAAGLSVSVTTTDVSCHGGSDGTATATTVGGTAPYTYAWSGGSNQNLPAGNYSVTVTDANGQTAATAFVINEPDPVVITGTVTNASPGNADGAIDISVSGGCSPYLYAWSNGSTSEDISGAAYGTYSVTVTDCHSCQAIDSFTVGESCGIPTGLSVTIQSPTSAMISWDAVNGATSYEVQYQEAGMPWQSQTTSNNSIVLTGLTSQAEYFYKVQAHCQGGWSAFSPVKSFTMPAPCDAPLNASATTVTATAATITWNAAPNASGYLVNYRPAGTTTWLSTTVTTNQVQLSGLMSNTTYECRIKTECGSFDSGFGDLLIFTTMQACGPPSDVVAEVVSYTAFKLDWSPVPGATAYSVRHRPTGTANWTSQDLTAPPVTVSVSDGGTYDYQVQTKCGGAWSAFTDTAQIALPDGCTVDSVQVTAVTQTTFSLAWIPTTGAGQYRVRYRVSGSQDSWAELIVANATAIVMNLTPNTSYDVYVQASCALGWGAKSSTLVIWTMPMGVDQGAPAPGFVFYPNPAHDYLTVKFDMRPVRVHLYDVLGRRLRTYPGKTEMQIATGHLEPGMYLLVVEYAGGGVRHARFMVR